ncbi:MAG: hypothetical protein ISQ11_05890 [Planctomycetes bacterium]|nr:hypothetical protein [Planctomycetota bacterium]
MSEPQGAGAEVGETAMEASGGADRASALRVVTVAALLLLLAAAGALLVRPWETTLEPEVFLSEVFAGVDEPLPGGLMVDEARRLPTGERFIRYEAAEPSEASGAVELTIVEVPASRGDGVLKEQLTGLRYESESMGSGQRRPGSWGGRSSWGKKERASKLREKGTFSWHGYDADFARLWHEDKASGTSGEGPGSEASSPESPESPERPGAAPRSYETIRVNLSTGGRCLLAYIRFGEGRSATEEAAAAIVASFRPVD